MRKNCVQVVHEAWQKYVGGFAQHLGITMYKLIARLGVCVEALFYTQSLLSVTPRLYTAQSTQLTSVKSHIIPTIHKTYYYYYYLYKQ